MSAVVGAAGGLEGTVPGTAQVLQVRAAALLLHNWRGGRRERHGPSDRHNRHGREGGREQWMDKGPREAAIKPCAQIGRVNRQVIHAFNNRTHAFVPRPMIARPIAAAYL